MVSKGLVQLAATAGAGGSLAYLCAVVADNDLRKADAAAQYPHQTAVKTGERVVHREPCTAFSGHDAVVVERTYRLDRRYYTAEAQHALERETQSRSAVASALTLTCLRRRFWQWSFGAMTDTNPDGTPFVERYRALRLEPHEPADASQEGRGKKKTKRVETDANKHSSMLNGPSESMEVVDQSVVKCVDADPSAPCVADLTILCPEYLRKMVEVAALPSAGEAASCLVLGGGAGCLAASLAHNGSAGMRVASVDVEPRTLAVGQTHLGVTLPDGAVAATGDALKYAREHPNEHGTYDAVFVDVFSGGVVPPEFRVPFLKEMKRLVKPDGGKVVAFVPNAAGAYRLTSPAGAVFGAGNVEEKTTSVWGQTIIGCTRKS
uniref:Methyltransferase type 11 domain-containing protein n=2 Tax=Neobodo designis TaxID=312471 RepID=A0A7S1MV08_NEODS|mmetsp:Transcript_46657/g.143878  ORF Transcript_46657/g.143878 Transcript_46657/m.143878 type:complete len:378 (+) Transcript_46657:25-1158(+)